jgi:cation:H+ antiporter
MLVSLLLFAVSAAAVGAAGWVLVAAADVIAARTGLGRAFLGMILLATVTTLPELSTGLSAITLIDAPDLAVGAAVGSCVFNLLLFALADAASRKVAFYSRLSASHNLAAAFGIVLLGLLALSVLAPASARASIGHVGLFSLVLGAFYLGSARLLYLVDVRVKGEGEREAEPRMTMRAALIRCAGASVVIVAGGIVLALSADALATRAGLTDTFVGVLFLAAATSLPEMIIVLSAVRMRSYDLAAGNLLGANLVNGMLIAVYDLAYLDGPILASVSDLIAAPAVVAMMMTAVIVAALNYVRRSAPGPVDLWAGLSLVSLYLFNAWLLFQAR